MNEYPDVTIIPTTELRAGDVFLHEGYERTWRADMIGHHGLVALLRRPRPPERRYVALTQVRQMRKGDQWLTDSGVITLETNPDPCTEPSMYRWKVIG